MNVHASSDPSIQPFSIDIPQGDVDDLIDRLHRTRWSPEIPDQGWSRGVPVDYLKDLATYWADGYDWRAQEKRLNQYPQFVTEISDQAIHFAHVRSANPDAIPLLLLHDWPASFVSFIEVIEPLSSDFHLVVPDVPGVAFSGPLTAPGWNVGKLASTFLELMERLGYDRYGVQGQGGGAWYGIEMGRVQPKRVIGVHVNGWVTFPSDDPNDFAGLTDGEQQRLGRLQNFRDDMMGFYAIQSTRPQTLAHGLADSPAGQLAWIVEKFKEWTDAAADLPEDAVDKDILLTNVSLYWFTRTAGSSANLYYELTHDPDAFTPKEPSTVPTAVALASSTDVTIQRFGERMAHITRWTEFPQGGNFLPLEQPEAFVDDVRAFFGTLPG